MRWRSASASKKQQAFLRGLHAESMVGVYMMLRGCKILARRYKTPVGEIDLIARRGKTILFVEVKARANKAQALEAVHVQAQGRIIRAAQYFISQHPRYNSYAMRFDVAAFCPPFRVHYLDNAWQGHT